MDIFKVGLSLLIAGVSIAHAGTESSGGGGAYVCRDAAGHVTSARLVDLWESQNSPFVWSGAQASTLNITLDDGASVSEQIDRAISNLSQLDEALGPAVQKEIDVIKASIHNLPPGVALAIPGDLHTDYQPTGCPPEGMLRYNGLTSKLDVVPEIFAKLSSNTDIAAAYVHEALYKILRDGPDKAQTSVLARRLVACAFSLDCIAAAQFKRPHDKRAQYECRAKNFTMIAYPVEEIVNPTFETPDWVYVLTSVAGHQLGSFVGYTVHYENKQCLIPNCQIFAYTEMYNCDPEIAKDCSQEDHSHFYPTPNKRTVSLREWMTRFGYHPVIDRGSSSFSIQENDLSDIDIVKTMVSQGALYSGLPGSSDYLSGKAECHRTN